MKKIITLLCATAVLAGCATSKKEQTKAPRNIGIAMYTFHKRTLEEMAPFMKDL
ncbi:MAG: lipoprotein, partial [Opitutales bacterium]|nr:lipoprotein [Opitutales bacterium]